MEVYFMQKVAGIANLFKLLEPGTDLSLCLLPLPILWNHIREI